MGAGEDVLVRAFSPPCQKPWSRQARGGGEGVQAKALGHTLAFGWGQDPLVVRWCAVASPAVFKRRLCKM